MKLIWKLLRKHISISELAIFFIANLIGMTVILSGVQIYSDVRPMLSGEESLIGNDYMIITRPVERVGTTPLTFSEADIEALLSEEFVEDVGVFTSSQYEVNGSIVFNGRKLSTMMFFEAVPDNFIDVDTEEWNFRPADRDIPIIIPRNYLNLYNFGFSHTQNLPQITEDIIKRVELGVEIEGNGHRGLYTGRIVGFSDRLNTILVPMAFMEWANATYSRNQQAEATRLILEVENPGAPELTAYLADHGYVAEDKPSESSKALFLLQVSIAIIVCIGLLFSVLSIAILTLSIYLLLQKNIDKLNTLMLIGYTPRYVALPYNMLTLVLNLSVLCLSIVVVFFAQDIYMGYISEIAGVKLEASPITAVIVGVALSAAVILFNVGVIHHKIKRISRR